MEMFERDTQDTVNDFLSGRTDETAFLVKSRPWPNYESAYRPLIMFAKEKGIPVVAANIPRRMAAAYAHGTALDGLDAADKLYLPRIHREGSAAYREKFTMTMKGMTAGAMVVPEERIEPMFRAQCLKDDAMAELLGSDDGIGSAIGSARAMLDTVDVMAYVVLIVTIIMSIEYGLLEPLRRLFDVTRRQ